MMKVVLLLFAVYITSTAYSSARRHRRGGIRFPGDSSSSSSSSYQSQPSYPSYPSSPSWRTPQSEYSSYERPYVSRSVPSYPSYEGRSGGTPKFPLQILTSLFSGLGAVEPKSEPTCGVASVQSRSLYPFFPGDDRQGRVIGGKKATYGRHPWQVEVQVLRRLHQGFVHHCGGALVSSQHVLTAAHCLRNFSPDRYQVRLGEHDLTRTDEKEVVMKLDRFVLHPNYRLDGHHSHDIAIIKLNEKVQFSSHIKPICLPRKEDAQPQAGKSCTITGWGITKAGDEKSVSSVLMEATVPLVSHGDCRRSYSSNPNSILDGMLCAGYTQGGTDTCGGDSGGPLACDLRGRAVLMGLVSWGDGCGEANSPGVYVNVPHYLDWIQKSMSALS